jgi:RNA polymerase sigma-70 factor (ECF subfamily)
MQDERTWKFPTPLGIDDAEKRCVDDTLQEKVVELYQTMRHALLGYVHQFVGSTAEAEDIVQTTFLKTFDEMQKAKILNLRAWLYRVAHNLAIDHLRRNSSQETAATEWLFRQTGARSQPSVEETAIRRQRVSNVLKLLNDRERNCLMLRSEGLSYGEIGEVLGISSKAVSVYLVRGLKKVRGNL